MNNSTTKYSEAKEDARRLTKVTGRNVEAVSVVCPCDFSKNCYCCGGEGTYYEPHYRDCLHLVTDSEYECAEAGCVTSEEARYVLVA